MSLWLTVRFNLLASVVMGVMASVAVMNGNISASLAGFALSFTSIVRELALVLAARPKSIALDQQ